MESLSYALPASALPASALPASALPCRALCLIHDYSRPLTRSDWRQSKPIITIYKLYEHLLNHSIDYTYKKSPDRLYQTTLYHIAETEWYFAFTYIRFYGINRYIERMNGDDHLIHSDGIEYAMKFNKSLHNY